MFRTAHIAGLSIILVAALFLGQAAQATMREYHKTAKSGQPTLIGHLYDCNSHVPVGNAGAFEHGAVNLKDVQIDQCGNHNEPAKEIWYTSTPGFKGVDKVQFMWGKRGVAGMIFIVDVQ